MLAGWQGLRTRQEGLVHVQNMSKTRVGSAKDVVKRGQEVWVKVISMQGQKISLSMRDVDQASARAWRGSHAPSFLGSAAISHTACMPTRLIITRAPMLVVRSCSYACAMKYFHYACCHVPSAAQSAGYAASQ